MQGVLRKLIAMHVLKEETWRQDNQYGNVMACLKVNKREADSLVASKQPIIMPQLVTGSSRPSGSSSAAAAPVPAKKGRQGHHAFCHSMHRGEFAGLFRWCMCVQNSNCCHNAASSNCDVLCNHVIY